VSDGYKGSSGCRSIDRRLYRGLIQHVALHRLCVVEFRDQLEHVAAQPFVLVRNRERGPGVMK
jgi:hypothetical protein